MRNMPSRGQRKPPPWLPLQNQLTALCLRHGLEKRALLEKWDAGCHGLYAWLHAQGVDLNAEVLAAEGQPPLMLAARLGQEDHVDAMLAHGTCLLDRAIPQDAALTRALLGREPKGAAFSNARGESPLHVAVRAGSPDLVEAALPACRDLLTRQDNSGATPVEAVLDAPAHQVELLRLLLRAAPKELAAQAASGVAAACLERRCRDVPLFEEAMRPDWGAGVTQRMWHLAAAQLLSERLVAMMRPGNQAIAARQPPCASVADPSAAMTEAIRTLCARYGRDAEPVLAQDNPFAIYAWVKACSIDLDSADAQGGCTLAMTAARLGLLEHVASLHMHGANLHLRDDAGDTAIDLAFRAGKADVINYLLKGTLPAIIPSRVRPKQDHHGYRSCRGETLLHLAVRSQSQEVVRLTYHSGGHRHLFRQDAAGIDPLTAVLECSANQGSILNVLLGPPLPASLRAGRNGEETITSARVKRLREFAKPILLAARAREASIYRQFNAAPAPSKYSKMSIMPISLLRRPPPPYDGHAGLQTVKSLLGSLWNANPLSDV